MFIFKQLSALLLLINTVSGFSGHATNRDVTAILKGERRSYHSKGIFDRNAFNLNKKTYSARSTALSLSGGDVGALIGGSYDWTVNYGAPAALVAGAVIGTIYEKKNSDSLVQKATDPKWVGHCKRLTYFLLMAAFSLEVISIFVTTVTGTMLLSATETTLGSLDTTMTSSLVFLKKNFEFEYLTSRVSFLQGLISWITAIAIDFAIPNDGENATVRNMNKAVSGFLGTSILMMISFYNGHMTFYNNYFEMLSRWAVVTWKRFIWTRPIRPMAFLFVPAILYTMYLTCVALFSDYSEEAE